MSTYCFIQNDGATPPVETARLCADDSSTIRKIDGTVIAPSAVVTGDLLKFQPFNNVLRVDQIEVS